MDRVLALYAHLDPDDLVARVEDVLVLAEALTVEGLVGTDGSSPQETP